MKKHLIAAAALSLVLPATAQVKPDAVLMTVDGRPVTVGEFEYLYNKNKSQQTTPQSFDQYLEMFENYKLKVADAEHAGIDETPAFKSEFTKFRDELSEPYLRDQATEDALVEEAYGHRKNDVLVSHIMLPLEDGKEAQLDSIRTAILSGATTFEKAATEYSIDRSSSQRGGKMGIVVPDRYPWAFEKASYDTPVGGISPVINSGMGYHIIRVESVTPAEDDVDASHILLMTRGLDAAAQAAVKDRIDSIYTALQAGADFAQLASKLSQDPGSAARGGALGRFGHGMMVAEFDSAAYATPEGQISKPFKTAFGYHIVKTNKHFGVPALDDELRKSIVARMANDSRAKEPENVMVDKLMKEYGAKLNEKTLDKVRAMINGASGVIDSAMNARLIAMDDVVAKFKGGKVTVRDAMAYVPMALGSDTEAYMATLNEAADNALRAAVLEYAREQLAKTNADYRNLVNEYRDGILLYEISNQKVWDKAAKDKTGLEAFFQANKDRYKWEKPKFKSYVFFARNDSVLNLATAYADSLSTADPAKFTQDMRKRFGRDIKIERVIAAEGENAITDYLGFNGSKEAADKQSKWSSYAAWRGRLLDQPEEAADARGAAVTDYQAQLEAQWLDELHKKYPVKLNNKVLKKLKEQEK